MTVKVATRRQKIIHGVLGFLAILGVAAAILAVPTDPIDRLIFIIRWHPIYLQKESYLQKLEEFIGQPGDDKIYRYLLQEEMKYVRSGQGGSYECQAFHAYTSTILTSREYEFRANTADIFAEYYSTHIDLLSTVEKECLLLLSPWNQNESLLNLLIQEYAKRPEMQFAFYATICHAKHPQAKDFLLKNIENINEYEIVTTTVMQKLHDSYNFTPDDFRVICDSLERLNDRKRREVEQFLRNNGINCMDLQAVDQQEGQADEEKVSDDSPPR